MFVPFAAMLLGSQLIVTIADDFPQFNIAATCRTDQTAAAGPSLSAAGGCTRDEQDARARLEKIWSEFDPDDRATCTHTSLIGGPGSYIELITCLELTRTARQLPDSKWTDPVAR
jgi:hypothetical protein